MVYNKNCFVIIIIPVKAYIKEIYVNEQSLRSANISAHTFVILYVATLLEPCGTHRLHHPIIY